MLERREGEVAQELHFSIGELGERGEGHAEGFQPGWVEGENAIEEKFSLEAAVHKLENLQREVVATIHCIKKYLSQNPQARIPQHIPVSVQEEKRIDQALNPSQLVEFIEAISQKNTDKIKMLLTIFKNSGQLVFALNAIIPESGVPVIYALLKAQESCELVCALPELDEITSDNLNFIVPEYEWLAGAAINNYDIGETPLSWLTYHSYGRAALATRPILRSKIKSEALNWRRNISHVRYTSALYWLTRDEGSFEAIYRDPDLQAKIGSDTLTHVGHHQHSPLADLTRFAKGREVFCANPHLRDSVSLECFYAVILSGNYMGNSPAYNMLFSERCLEFFEKNPQLLEMPDEFLKTIIQAGPFKGKTITYWFANSENGQQLLNNNLELKAKINIGFYCIELRTALAENSSAKIISLINTIKERGELVTFINSIIPSGDYQGFPIIYVLLKQPYISLHLCDFTELQEITSENLNFIAPAGPDKDETTLGWLSRCGKGPEILHRYALLRAKITSAGLNHVAKGKSPLSWLTKTMETFEAVYIDPALQVKIEPSALNSFIENGITLLFNITRFEKGREVFCVNPHLRDYVDPASFYSIISMGDYIGRSAAGNILISEKCMEFFQHNPELLLPQNVPMEFLNTTINEGPYSGQTFTHWFLNSENGKQLLEDNEELKSKVIVASIQQNLVTTKWKVGFFKRQGKPASIAAQIKEIAAAATGEQTYMEARHKVMEIGKAAATKSSFFRHSNTQEYYDLYTDENKFKLKFGAV